MPTFFKSKKQREKEARRRRRQAFRQAQNAIDTVKDRIKQMEKDSGRKWEQARELLKSGQKAAAQRQITGYRAAQVLMMKLEQKRWVFEQYLMKMETAQTDTEFADALAAVNKVVAVDPEQVADVFEASQDVLGEQMDADRFWNKLYEKEMDGAKGALEDHIPTLDDMMQQLEDEAGAEIGEAGADKEKVAGELGDRIGRGHERVKKILDGK